MSSPPPFSGPVVASSSSASSSSSSSSSLPPHRASALRSPTQTRSVLPASASNVSPSSSSTTRTVVVPRRTVFENNRYYERNIVSRFLARLLPDGWVDRDDERVTFDPRTGKVKSQSSSLKNAPPKTFLQRLLHALNGSTHSKHTVKILHDDVTERTIHRAVRRNSLKKVGLSDEEITKALTVEASASRVEMFLVHPDSIYRMLWDLFTALFVLYLIWLVPFYVGFDKWYPPTGMKVVNSILDAWFIFDVALNFRTGYVDHGMVVMDSRRIGVNYLRTYFTIDFFASIPWELFLSTVPAARKSLKLTKYFKIPKLLRVARMIRLFRKYARFYGLTLSIMTLFTLLHFGACTIARLVDICAENDGLYQNTTDDMLFFRDASAMPCIDGEEVPGCLTHLCASRHVTTLYAESLWISMSLIVGSPVAPYVGGELTKTGCMYSYIMANNLTYVREGVMYGHDGAEAGRVESLSCPSDIMTLLALYNADNSHFVLFTIMLLIGVAQVSMLFGHLSIVLQSRYQASAAFRQKLDRVKAECEYYRVPWDLQNRVFAYYDYLWVNQKQYDDRILLMNDRGMSSDLRGKLALFLYKDVIQGVTLFERVDDPFLSKICMELQTRVYLPQDWVILKGDIGSELYIISRGVVQVYVIDPNEGVEDETEEEGAARIKAAEDASIYLHRGNFFGEVSLLMETRRTTSVQAKTICELNVLVQEVFEEILRESPEFAEEMKNLVLERKLHNAESARKIRRDSGVSGDDAAYNEGTANQIEAAVVDAIESRQLLSNMRQSSNTGANLTQEQQQPHIDDVQPAARRPSFIKPIQDKLDLEERIKLEKEEEEREMEERAEAQAKAEAEKKEKEEEEDGSNGLEQDKKGVEVTLLGLFDQPRAPRKSSAATMASLLQQQGLESLNELDDDNEEGGESGAGADESEVRDSWERRSKSGRSEALSELGSSTAELSTNPAASASQEQLPPQSTFVPSAGFIRPNPNRMAGTASLRASFAESRNDHEQSSRSLEMTQQAAVYEQRARVLNDIISIQVATLQERTDKVYAMLTTKLGRVR